MAAAVPFFFIGRSPGSRDPKLPSEGDLTDRHPARVGRAGRDRGVQTAIPVVRLAAKGAFPGSRYLYQIREEKRWGSASTEARTLTPNSGLTGPEDRT
jgi:hypothetical protein